MKKSILKTKNFFNLHKDELILFGSKDFPDWASVLSYLKERK